jgi:flagellar biosynthesis protein FlhA
MNPKNKIKSSNILSGFGVKNKDIAFASCVMLVLAVFFVPLPSVLLDFGLSISLMLSFLILMVALWIPKPLDFNSFPTLLLVATTLRLSLNIASTRLILSEGHTGTDAAGSVIEGFSRFIVGGDYLLGIIIFTIIVIINFLVITKGSTRIAEVSARFTLDSIPGKQMAIDADLGSGVIDDVEAARRRQELNNESSFFGSMDGASKFVRGDAIAGIIITLINIVGGIIVGIVNHNMEIGAAATNYTTLTIGDGLVTQIPALVISLAAGMIVTKGGTTGAANEAVIDQLGNYPKAMYMAGGLLILVGLMPGFPFTLFGIIGLSLIGSGYFIQRKRDEKEALEKAAAEESDYHTEYMEETPESLLHIDDIKLEMGSALVNLVSNPDAALPGKVRSLRHLFIENFGFVMPKVRIKDDASLQTHTYSIRISGTKVATGLIRPNQLMLINPTGDKIDLEGEVTQEPSFGLNAMWIDPNISEKAELMGYTVVDPESVITTHVTEIIKEFMPSLLTYKATQELVSGLDKSYQKLLSDINQNSPTILLQKILQNLLSERVSIRNLPLIIEALAESAMATDSVATITNLVRQKLSNQICQSLENENGKIPVVLMSAEWENEFVAKMSQSTDNIPLVTPQRMQEFVLDARRVLAEFAEKDEFPSLVVNPQLRVFIKDLLERVSPMTSILSNSEIHRKAEIIAVATIARSD